MNPVTHKEFFLAKLAGEDVPLPTPVTHEEMYLAKLCGMDVTPPIPASPDEMYLAKLCGMNVTLPPPVTRYQFILLQMIKTGRTSIVPVTHEERFWAAMNYYHSVTGNPVTFTAKRAEPLKRLEVAIEPVQSGSGDPSPDNVRPISGFSAVNVNQSSQNHFANVTVEQGTIASNGSLTNSDYRIRFASYVFLPKGTYKIKTEPVLYGTIRVYAEGNAGSYISGESVSSWTLLDGYSFTLANDRYVKLSMTSDTGTNVPISPSDFKYGCAAETLTTIPITIPTPPGTVYGGTLDVLTGVLTVLYKTITMDGAGTTTSINNGRSFDNKAGATYADMFYTQLRANSTSNVKYAALTEDILPFVKCSHAQTAPYLVEDITEVVNNGGVAFTWYMTDSNNNPRLQTRLAWPKSAGVDTTAKANQFLADQVTAGTPVVYTVPLATPQTYQLTGEQVSNLVGGNTVWSDAGQVTVEYRAN